MKFKRNRQGKQFRSVDLPHNKVSYSGGMNYPIGEKQVLFNIRVEQKQGDDGEYEAYILRLEGINELRKLVSSLNLVEQHYRQGIFDEISR